jgi:hypothetical protein
MGDYCQKAGTGRPMAVLVENRLGTAVLLRKLCPDAIRRQDIVAAQAGRLGPADRTAGNVTVVLRLEDLENDSWRPPF